MIHCFENNGLRIALDVHSGAVHVLDELAFELLLSFPDDLPETCPPAPWSIFPGDMARMKYGIHMPSSWSSGKADSFTAKMIISRMPTR